MCEKTIILRSISAISLAVLLGLLADLAVESEAATALMLRLARSYDEGRDDPGYRRGTEWWGEVQSMTDGESVSAALTGDWLGRIEHFLPDVEITAAALEFGTVDTMSAAQLCSMKRSRSHSFTSSGSWLCSAAWATSAWAMLT